MDEIIFLKETTSTNDWLKEHCNSLSDGACVTAEHQTMGRGRRGHSWDTASGMLAMSVLLKNPHDFETLTARVGLAVCGAVEELYTGVKAGIKWSNDIIIKNRKVCGILCESVKFGDTLNVICGIGVNISQTDEYFKSAGLLNAVSLKEVSGAEMPKEILCKKIRENVISRAEMTFKECYEEYKARLLNLGREVRIIRGNDEKTAKAVDVAENGSLICEDKNGRFEVYSGEVTVRGKDGYL